jgi:hypothetical protein
MLSGGQVVTIGQYDDVTFEFTPNAALIALLNGAPAAPQLEIGTSRLITAPRSSMTVTMTPINLAAATSTPLIAANAARKYLSLINIGLGAASVQPGAGPAVVNVGIPFPAAPSVGGLGGNLTFDAGGISTDAWAGISTVGTTIIVLEGT